MKGFKYYTPTEIKFGRDAELQAGKMLKKYGATKVFVHYGSERIVKDGLLKRILDTLDKEGIAHVELGGVVPNPRLSKVREGIEVAREFGADFLFGVGGGSVLDSIKAIGYGLANEGDVWDFYEHTRMPEACIPMGHVLTLSATGSVMSDSSVITNEEGWKKRGCNSDLCRPAFALMNPELTMSVSPYQTASGSADIMMHTMERYFNKMGSMEITDAIATGILKTVMRNTKKALENPNDYNARAEIMWCESLSHNGLTGCGTDGGDWSCHKMEHEIGGLYDVAHGAGLTTIWGSWARLVCDDLPERFYKFAVEVMDVEPVGDEMDVIYQGIERMEDFFRSIGMPTNFKELGVEPTEEELHLMANKCEEANNGHIGSALTLYVEDMYRIYKEAAKK
ncbi:MAG: iron-containing alcohol dehydrogenase [Clostridiales bacterium]|nr:iron-containing alcohol dehydrogenase [Clostridiales bacterium]